MLQETKWSVPWFDCDESLTCQCLNLNLRHFGCFTFIFILFGQPHLLVSWCAGDRCGMAAAMRIVVEVGDLVQKTEDGHTGRVLDDRMIG
jgi:hypothetical protein